MKGFAFAAALLAVASPAWAQKAPTRPVARAPSGAVQGVAEPGVVAFKGIRYAEAPVGPLRWKAPVPAAKWSGVRDASKYGTACPQPSDHKEYWARVGATGEDCLFLNVWRPAKPGKYPVMFFIHGGGFTYGAAGVQFYDGANLARRGVVVVTINYRLGRLGFFAHPALTAEDPNGLLGNYAVMDMVTALRWTHDNIAAFGGNPGNVTIFGESAGAGSVQLLMATPSAKGLFHKAISESGAGGNALAPIRGGAGSAEADGVKIIEGLGLKDATADQLRALPVEKLEGRAFPFIDGKVVVASPAVPFLRNYEMKVPLIMGANSYEGSLTGGKTEPLGRMVLGAKYDNLAKAYIAARPDKTPEAAKVDLAEDAISLMPSLSVAVLHAANGAPAYDYYFDQLPSNRRGKEPGTPHGGEVEYLFGNADEISTWDAADRKVSELIAGYWVRFAKTGNPNGGGAPVWPRVKGSGLSQYLVIGTPTAAKTLTPVEEEVRQTSLDLAKGMWAKEK